MVWQKSDATSTLPKTLKEQNFFLIALEITDYLKLKHIEASE